MTDKNSGERKKLSLSLEGKLSLKNSFNSKLTGSITTNSRSGRNTVQSSCIGWVDFEPSPRPKRGIQSAAEMAASLDISEEILHNIAVSFLRYLLVKKRRYLMPSLTYVKDTWSREPRITSSARGRAYLDKIVANLLSEGINNFKNPTKAIVLITHYKRLLEYIQPDFIHIIKNGKIVKTGDYTLADLLEKKGYEWLANEED